MYYFLVSLKKSFHIIYLKLNCFLVIRCSCHNHRYDSVAAGSYNASLDCRGNGIEISKAHLIDLASSVVRYWSCVAPFIYSLNHVPKRLAVLTWVKETLWRLICIIVSPFVFTVLLYDKMCLN